MEATPISHPHYYASMVEWSRALGDAPIYLHEDEAQWLMYGDGNVEYWKGEELDLAEDPKLLRLGGHFPGYQVLHWALGDGVLLAGDLRQVCANPEWVSFMDSYPNFIPLPAGKVEDIAARLRPLAFDRLYGALREE